MIIKNNLESNIEKIERERGDYMGHKTKTYNQLY